MVYIALGKNKNSVLILKPSIFTGTLPPLLVLTTWVSFFITKKLFKTPSSSTIALPLSPSTSMNKLGLQEKTFFRSLTERNQPNIEEFLRAASSDQENVKCIDMELLQLEGLNIPRDERRKVHKTFINSLTNVYKSKPSTLIWIKENIHHSTARKILINAKHSNNTMERLTDLAEDTFNNTRPR